MPSTSRYDRSVVDGPLGRAVWRLAWPAVLTNIIGGLQGMVDHVMVGNIVGYEANAAIGRGCTTASVPPATTMSARPSCKCS